ncbi:MAG TPA: hypothetical protein VGA08_02100 [Candidatus Saccharimonadales bacterium]
MNRIRLMFLAVLVGTLMLFAINTHAQDDNTSSGNGLRITPVRQEYSLAPGQAESYEVEITNISQAPIEVTVIVNDFESDDVTGQPRIIVDPDQKSPFSLKQYVSLPADFRLEPGGSQKVTIAVNLPDSLNPGGYFGIVRFAPKGITAEEGAVALNASVGSLLLVSIPGDVTEGLTLQFIEARRDGSTRGIFESAPNTLAIGLDNTGNSILKPFGRVAIENIFGNEVYSYEFNGGQLRGNVLPQSSRTFEDEIHNIGKIGRYTVEANLSFGEGGGEIIAATTTFWVIPWRLILVALALIALVIWFVTRGLKSYNRRVVAQAKRNS